MARRWKEEHSFTKAKIPKKPVLVDFSVEGKAMRLDITDCIAAACETIIDPIVSNVKSLISSANPEYHNQFRQNMILGGGGSGIKGLGAMIEDKLSDLGKVKVHTVDDPVKLGALGGLRLSMEVPQDLWKNLTLSSR